MSGQRDTSFDHLVPELPHWNNGDGIDIDDWIGCIGRHDHAIAYARVFWPEFVLHDGYLLRAGFRPEDLAGFVRQTGGDRRAVEAVMNHEHVVDIFMGQFNHGEDVSRDQVLYLGRLLKEMWTARLARDFPDLNIVVRFSEGSDDDLEACEITVFQ